MEPKRERKRYTERITPGVPPPVDGKPVGIECRHCGCRHFRVVYTRPGARRGIVRRRECRHCQTRITTVEKPKDEHQSDEP